MKVLVSATGRLELSVESDWSEMETVNQTIHDFLESRGLSFDLVNAITMIACELVENSIKYGNFDAAESNVAVILSVEPGINSVVVRNPIGDLTIPYLHELDRIIQWIRGFQDPFEAYIERMKAISNEPLLTNKSGLGIVRMAYEGRAYIDFFLEENAILNVSAVSFLS